jgi:uncharacterized membrane protein (DUF2068 family)
MSLDPSAYPGPSTPPATESGAVTAVSVVNYLLGVLQLMCGGCLTFGGGVLAGLGGFMNQEEAGLDPEQAEAMEQVMQLGGGVIAVLGVAYLLFGVLLLVAGYGVMKRQRWGRTLTLVLGGIAGVLAILGLLGGEWFGTTANLAYAIFVFVVLLNRRYAAEFV